MAEVVAAAENVVTGSSCINMTMRLLMGAAAEGLGELKTLPSALPMPRSQSCVPLCTCWLPELYPLVYTMVGVVH